MLDTDSIHAVVRDRDYMPEIGQCLGQYSDEVTDEYGVGAYITDFVATAPKSYCYLVKTPDGSVTEHTKAKGFTLNSEAKETINFKSMSRLVENYIHHNVVEYLSIRQPAIKRTRLEVCTKELEKTCSVICDKGVLLSNGFIRPFGY